MAEFINIMKFVNDDEMEKVQFVYNYEVSAFGGSLTKCTMKDEPRSYIHRCFYFELLDNWFYGVLWF